MGDPSRRDPVPRRLLAGVLAVLCALESGVLPAVAATKAAPVESAGSGALNLDSTPVAAPLSAPARHGKAGEPSFPDLLTPGVTAGRLRAAGRELVADAPENCRSDVAKWVALTLEEALKGAADGAVVSAAVLAGLHAGLPALRKAELAGLPPSVSPAALRAAQAAAAKRIARIGLPDFTARGDAGPVPVAAASPARTAPVPVEQSAQEQADIRERLAQKGDMLGGARTSDELARFQRVAQRTADELGPADPGGPSGADDARDARWASLESLRRLFEQAGAKPDSAPAGPPLPPGQVSRIETRVNNIAAMKLTLTADLAQRDAAEALLAVKARLRDDALSERRSGKDDLEFRKNFSRLAMVMDLSYSLNILNSADAALAKMQGLLDQKIAAIAQQRQANDNGAASTAGRAANTDQWKKDAQAQAAADQSQATSFASLGGSVSKVGAAVAGFQSDVPGLLAMIDARDKGRSASALAEYDRRLALLPSMAAALKNGSSDPTGVSSLSLSYLQAKSREVAGDKILLAGADSKITSVPVEFAGALVVAVPGVPSETAVNPSRDQLLALLERRRAYWQSQLDEHTSILNSIQRAMDPANRTMTVDDFGSPQPESLAVWKANELSLDDQLAAAEAPMAARADADEALIEAAAGGAALTRLSGLSPDDMRTRLPQLLDQMDALPLPDSDAGFAAKAAHIDLARLITFLGDATARRLEARATAAALDKPVGVILPKAHDAFVTAVAAWKAVLDDVTADEAYVKAGGPAAQADALIARKRALLANSLTPALNALQDLLDNTLIPYQNDRIAQSDPANTGDGYATLYTQKKLLYQQISDGLHLTLPWALASDGAKAYDVGAARAGISAERATFDTYRGVVADYQDQMRRRQDPNDAGTEDVYGETAPYSLVKRVAVYQAEKAARASSMNAAAVQINGILAQMDSLDGGKHALLSTWKLPTDLDPNSPATADRLNAIVNGNVLQNMAAAIKAVADAATAAGGAPSVSVGGGSGIPVGTQPPLDVTPLQKLALYGLEAVKRLVPSTATGAAGDSYAQSLARYLFADALVSSSQLYLTDRIPRFVAYLNRAKSALDAAEADLDSDLAWVSGDRSGGDAVLARKSALFSGLAVVLNDGAALFQQKSAWSASGADTAIQAASYYNGLNQTYVSGNQALDAELSAAQQFQAALADSKSKIDSQRAEVVGWLGQLNSPNESALSRVAQNISTIQDKTRAVLETNIAARQAERERDQAAASVERTLRAMAAERVALDQSLSGVGDLARLGPDLAARTRDAVGSGGAWIAESPSASTLVIPRGQLETFLGQLFSGLSSDAAAANIASLRADILKDPTALARLIPGSKVIPVGQGPDGFYLVYQTEFSTPGGLETANSATLGNIGKLWGQNISLIGYRFESPPSAGNAPFGDQGVTVQLESLDSDHAVNYLDVTFHKFLQDVPTDLGGVAGQAQEARMMIFDDFALLLADGKVYFGAAGFGDIAASGAAGKPQYYGGNLKTSVKFTKVLTLNASETALFAKDPRQFLQTVNLDFTKYDPTLDQTFIVSGSGDNKTYRRDQVGVGIDLKEALKQKDTFMLDLYYAHVSGTDDVNQSLAGATILKGFTFDFLGQKAGVTVGGGAELGQVQNDFNGRVSFELPDQGVALSLQGKYIGTGSAYYAELRKKMGDHSTASVSYGSPYIGLNNRAAITFSSSYTLGELWRAVTGQAASDLTGGKALADFDKALSDFFVRSPQDTALVELKKVFDADVGRQLAALEIGQLSREIETLTRAGALLDNTRQSAMVGFVSNPIGPGTAEAATGGGFQVGTRTDLTLTKTQRALIVSKSATLFSLGLDMEERLLDLTKAWQLALSDLAQARWRELLAGWLAAHADDPVLRAEAEADAAAAADARRQAELKYDSLTGRAPDEVPAFDGVSPQDFDVLLAQVSASLARADRVGALLQRARGQINIPQAGFNVLDWIPWVEKLSFTVGAQLPDTLSSQPLGIGLTITLPVYDPTRGHNDAAMLLARGATMEEMAGRLRQTRLRAHGERLSAQAWAARARDAASLQNRLAQELSDGIRQYRNGLIEASELRARARRWRDAVSETLSARTRASLETAWASLDENGHPNGTADATYAEPADMKQAFDQAARTSSDYEALALRSQAAAELLAAADRRVRKVDVDVNLGTNLTATGLALLPAFGVTGLSAMPIVGIQLAPEELRQLDVARTGAEAGLYSRLRDKAQADAALSLTQATIDGSWLDKQIALYRDELLPGLESAQDGSSDQAYRLSEARAAYADLLSRRRQTTAAMNQMLGRPLDAALKFSPDTAAALTSYGGRAAALDPVAAARDALDSRVKIARATELAVDKNLHVDQLRLEPISLIGQSLGRLVAALSGDAVASPELMALARERTIDAERALEAFDAEVPAVRARLAAQLSAVRAARAALSGRADPESRLQDLELGRQEDLLSAQIASWGGGVSDAADGALPSSYAELEDRLRQAEERATFPSEASADSGAISAPGAVEMQGNVRWYDARETLAGDPIGRQFTEGWVEARLRSPLTPPAALAMLADLREKAADERRRLDTAGADARAELLLSRLRLGAGLLRWSEGVGLGDTARARVDGDLAEAAALLHLPPGVKPARLLDVMPADGDADLAAVASRYLDEAESLDLESVGRTLFLDGLPKDLQDSAGRNRVPELRADLIAERMSSRGFTPVAAFGLFKGQWVSGAFLEAPKPEQIQDSLTSILDDALRGELESRDRLKSLGLLLHALMASVADKTRLVAAARLRETTARRALGATLERVRLRMAPVSEAAAAAAEAQAAQEAFVSSLYALREDFARLTTELTALGINPAPTLGGSALSRTTTPDDPMERTPREKLLAYWADRMKDPDFERRVEDLLAGQPDSVRASLRDLSARYRTASRDADGVRSNDFTPAETLDLLTKTDVQGRRRAIEEVLGRVLSGLQDGDAAHSTSWAGLMDFLRSDVTAQAAATAGDLSRGDGVRGELRSTFSAALGGSPAQKAEMARLETLQTRADQARRQALASWLARDGGAEDHLLKDKALDAYVSALDAFDAEMEKALSAKEAASDAGWARSLDALYGVRDSLARRRDRLQYGRGLLTIDAAITLDESRLRALNFTNDESREVGPAGESLAFLRNLRTKWTGKPDSIPALVALRGKDGDSDWATVEDLAKAKLAGRVTVIGGKRFLRPADVPDLSPKDAGAALAQGWREVIEGEDAARERLNQARARRADAAREAALTATLKTAEVALTAGAAGGDGPVRTTTLADLREREASGRVLWFEATPDPRTGLRRAVPAVAARWRDPADLVLLVLDSGDTPAPGFYPTLESLLASPDARRFSRGRLGAAGLSALEREASAEALAARREGWLKLKLNAWGFALDPSGAVAAVYLSEDELRSASSAAADPKDPGHSWTYLRADAVSLGLTDDGTLTAVRAGNRTIALGDGTPTRWISQAPLAMETDSRGRVTRLFLDRKELDRVAMGWSLEDSQGRTWQGGDALPPLLRARRWTDPSTGLTVALGRDLLAARRDAAKSGAKGAGRWGYMPAQWPGLITEIPRGIVSTPIEIVTGRDPNQQGYLGRVNARRGEGGATVARGALGSVLRSIDLFGLMNDPVDRYFDPSQYPDAVRRDAPLLPGASAGDAGLRTTDGKKDVFYGAGSFTREAGWAEQDLEASRAEVLAAFRGGVRRETSETVRGRAGDYADSTVGLNVGRGAALAAIDELGARLDAGGSGRISDSPRRGAVDRMDTVVQIVAGADTQDARVALYEAALKHLQDAPPPDASDAEIADARAALSSALAARRAANAALAAAKPSPSLPGYPSLPLLYASLAR